MWILFAVGSAVFAGITSVLAKCGIQKTDSVAATALRTIVVLVFSWGIVLAGGSADQLAFVDSRTFIFLILSGAATGASWLCYFRALQTGEINKVVPIDKSSTVLTILFALIFFQEGISVPKAAAVVFITAGIYLMIEKKEMQEQKAKGSWMLYAAGSAVFASLTAILGKIGIAGVDSNLGTAVRTVVVLIMAWMMVLVTGKGKEVRRVDKKELAFIFGSGIATGASWLCYYRALQEGPASVVTPIDKLSILVTVAFSYFVFGERLSKRAAVGLCFLTAGTVAMALL